MNSNWAVLVSISLHDGEKDAPANETTHMISVPAALMTREQVEAFRELVVDALQSAGVMIYKEEKPREVH